MSADTRRRHDLRPFAGIAYIGALEAGGSPDHGRRTQPRASADSLSPSGGAASRARSVCRRYAVANDLNTLLTLTLRNPAIEPEQLLVAWRLARRRASRRQGPFASLWVPERGSESGRLHAHALVNEAHLQLLDWPLGFIDTEVQQGAEGIRQFAGYISKDFDHPLLTSRYSPARGFAPEEVRIVADSRNEFLEQACELFGGRDPVRLTEGPSGIGISAQWILDEELL